jgi:hypothetical protein
MLHSKMFKSCSMGHNLAMPARRVSNRVRSAGMIAARRCVKRVRMNQHVRADRQGKKRISDNV